MRRIIHTFSICICRGICTTVSQCILASKVMFETCLVSTHENAKDGGARMTDSQNTKQIYRECPQLEILNCKAPSPLRMSVDVIVTST